MLTLSTRAGGQQEASGKLWGSGPQPHHFGASKGGEEERGPSDGTAPLTPPSAFLTDVSCGLRGRVGQEGGVWIPQRMLAGTAKSIC